MAENILESVKSDLGLHLGDTGYDNEFITLINSAMSSLYQIGYDEFANGITDGSEVWPTNHSTYIMNMIKNYISLKVGFVWDPPTMSFLLEAKKEQINELETRLSYYREESISV